MKEFIYKNIANIYHTYETKNGTIDGASSLLSYYFGFMFMTIFLLFLVYLEKKWELNCFSYYTSLFRIEISQLERINIMPSLIPPYIFGYSCTYFFLTHNNKEKRIYEKYNICDKAMGLSFILFYANIPLVLLFILIII